MLTSVASLVKIYFYLLKVKALSLTAISALFTAGSIFAPAFARPYLYVSGFTYSGSANECLQGARKALAKAGFTRDLEIEKNDGDAAGKGGYVGGYLKNEAVTAEIDCDSSQGMTTLGVSGLNYELTYKKYEELFDAEW